MSAIAGLVLREARPQPEVAALLARMLDAMSHRGPDGRGSWASSRAAVGHLKLVNTPQSVGEALPLQRETRVLAYDGRLDDYSELVQRLVPLTLNARDVPDGELLLRAYERWGDDCPQHLLGEWAFALWDERKGRLFVSRDPFGMRSLYLYRGPEGVAFATEAKALLALPFVPQRLNEERLADHLTLTFADATSTFYRDIERLPPAHNLVVEQGSARTFSYYALDPQREQESTEAQSYAEGLYGVFERAVRDQMRVAPHSGSTGSELGGVGALLSGGLDSSSVAGVAQRVAQADRRTLLPLPVVSAIFPQVPACDERPYIEAVLGRGGFAPHWVEGDQAGPLSEIDRKLRVLGEPVLAPGLFLTWELLRAAQGIGLRVLMDGHGGDEVISLGDGYLTELARAGQWGELWARCQNIGHIYGDDVRRAWWNYYRTFGLVPRAQRSPLARLALRGGDLLLRRGTSTTGGAPESGPAQGVLLTSAFAERVGWQARKQALQAQRVPGSYGREQTARATHFSVLTDPLQVYSFEVSSHAAGAFGLELAMPFSDRRVIEYCLALPGSQKSARRGTRTILRQAMHDVLPPLVRDRTSKNDFTLNFVRGLRKFERPRLDELLHDGLDTASAWIDVARVRQAWQVVEGTTSTSSETLTQEAGIAWMGLQTALWLQQFLENRSAQKS